ncbi:MULTISPECIES: tetratricopeptide repeat protein [unclassified Anaerobiospirillum]|uniref:YfgM family protein n=1 Tax=unclassified Anaerobiospirillum TaxID=2647410 RepID=UPI001FF692C0|nr:MULTISPECIES: tetratricopeptide repeat protein [unclassified Anaerobiospirillum]MCK0526857.1 tetratricopeptide repeat protein [Anaerobiospirillum sp. NML120449]MCK0534295.1 tetratricopeptide repeat protein [Anaerobiospirillum sp. NML120511]MCK0539564.1 tetratricopeptide repeat protein [Anaerobiospirillum sp. NML02-A-032]
MDILTDEHEREEAVRKWWHEHWKPIALGVAIALAGLVGVRQYQAWQLSENQQTAYEVYQHQIKLGTSGAAALADAQKFIDQNKNVYGSLLALEMANVQIRAARYDEAQKLVSFAAANGGDLLAPQCNLVTARLQAQQGRYEDALATLSALKSDAYKIEVAETRGDVLLAKGDRQGAHDAYLEAIKATEAAKLQISSVLQLKFDSVIKHGDTPAYKLMNQQAAAMSATPDNVSGK